MSIQRYGILFLIFVILSVTHIPVKANIARINVDNNIALAQTTIWKEPSIIAQDETFQNVSRITASHNTLYGINNKAQLVIFDISVPFNMSLLAIEGSYNYLNLLLDNNLLYLTHDAGVAIFDISDRNNIAHLGGNDSYFDTIVHSGLSGISVKDQILYVGTKGNGIVIMNATNASNTFVIGTYLDGSSNTYDVMEIQDSTLFVADYNQKRLKIINVTNPNFPVQIKYISFINQGHPNGMVLTPTMAYISIEHFGVEYVNITEIQNSNVRYGYNKPSPTSVDITNDYLVVSYFGGRIDIFNTEINSWSLVSSNQLDFDTYDLYITQDLIYTANAGDGVKIIDYGKDDDNDGLTNGLEQYVYFTNPYNNDTDYDGGIDGEEIENGFNPLISDYQMTTPTSGLDPVQTTVVSTTSSLGGDGDFGNFALIVIILLIVGGIFVYQKRQGVRNKTFFPKVVNKSNISKQRRSSIQNKVKTESINRSFSCPSCGTSNPPLSTYCMQCGLYLDER